MRTKEFDYRLRNAVLILEIQLQGVVQPEDCQGCSPGREYDDLRSNQDLKGGGGSFETAYRNTSQNTKLNKMLFWDSEV